MSGFHVHSHDGLPIGFTTGARDMLRSGTRPIRLHIVNDVKPRMEAEFRVAPAETIQDLLEAYMERVGWHFRGGLEGLMVHDIEGTSR